MDSANPDDLCELMVREDILDTLKQTWPDRNAKMMTTAVYIYKFPMDLSITTGAPVHLAARDLLEDPHSDEAYRDFYVRFKHWRQLDLEVMTTEIQGAQEVVEDTLSRTPPDKDWFGEWKRGSDLQTNLLQVATNFLERCKENPPKM